VTNSKDLGTAEQEFEAGSVYRAKWLQCEEEKAYLLEAAKFAVLLLERYELNDTKPYDLLQAAIEKAEASQTGKP
jgi:hypothetical protein